MRSAELTAPHTFRLAEMAIDDPGPGEVQVRVEAVGVCGSDLHAFGEGHVAACRTCIRWCWATSRGTDCEDRVGVTGLAVGDRGALEPALYCYHCEWCLSGHTTCARTSGS